MTCFSKWKPNTLSTVLVLCVLAGGTGLVAQVALPPELPIPTVDSLTATSAPSTQPASAAAPVAVEAAATPAAPSEPLVAAPVKPELPAADSKDITVNPVGTFEIHVQGADLRGVLQQLSTQGRRNIVATKEVTGKVSADLYGVTFREALEAVLRSTGFVYEEKDNFIYVYTKEQWEKIRDAERKMSVCAFKLAYLTANDAKMLIAPALSKDGTVSNTPNPVNGIAESPSETGGINYAREDVVVVRDYDENVQRVAALLKELDVKPQQVLIEATILRATLQEDNKLGVNVSVLNGIDLKALGIEIQSLTSNTVGSLGASGPGLTIAASTGNVDYLIRALESVTPVTVTANPKLLVVNKQRGQVIVGEKLGYVSATSTSDAGTTNSTIDFLTTGTTLIVRPFIGKDGFIRMEIHPKESSGSIETKGEQNLPRETTTELTSNVMVRDGSTIIIGGLFRERTTSPREQIPVVGNVPVLGALFRNTSDSYNREEMIILLTPRIVKTPNDHLVGAHLKDEVERYRIGARKDLRWWGRNRLAETHLRWAKQCLRENHGNMAMWNLDLALSMDPQMIEAVHMKERMCEKAYWADSARTSTAGYVIERLIMHELGKPYSTVISPDRPRDPACLPADVKAAFEIDGLLEAPLPGQTPACPPPAVVPPKSDADTKFNPVTCLQIKETTPMADQKAVDSVTEITPATQPAGKK